MLGHCHLLPCYSNDLHTDSPDSNLTSINFNLCKIARMIPLQKKLTLAVLLLKRHWKWILIALRIGSKFPSQHAFKISLTILCGLSLHSTTFLSLCTSMLNSQFPEYVISGFAVRPWHLLSDVLRLEYDLTLLLFSWLTPNLFFKA